jgi:AcrR family transcriptional regulator
MPKDTFFNLPEDKRELICEVALDEFAAYNFQQASINRIIERSAIAKGSFYQYFADKRDLFMHLIQRMGEAKLRYVGPVMADIDQYGFFEFFAALSTAGLQFARHNPRYIQIGAWMMGATRDAELDQMMAEANRQSAVFFKTLLERGIATGEIRADIDLTVYSHVLANVYTAMFDVPGQDLIQDMEVTVNKNVAAFIDLLKYGIAVEQLELKSSTQGESK